MISKEERKDIKRKRQGSVISEQLSVDTGQRTDVRAWKGKELDGSPMNESEPIFVL